ncbi:MAG: gluconokinase [Fibrobacterota bacterium]|nr:gluconokinase [Fibrobacterota bacterium]
MNPFPPSPANACVLLLMGVSGSGKTTVGKMLAERLGWPFYDGDDFHPKSNVDKMSQGLALNDRDRGPWLLALHDLLIGITARKGCAVLAASVLKQDYRDRVAKGIGGIKLVYLKGEYPILQERLKRRQGHPFKAALLGSQFEILEEPADALLVRVDTPAESMVDCILKEMTL